MRPVRFVALGDSLTEGVGDFTEDGPRGWAALLAPSLGAGTEFTNLAVSGAQTRDVLERQTPAALALRPDLVAVVVGVNDTLRHTFDIHAVAARLDQVYAACAREGATLLTACVPDPGAMLGLPSALAAPLARRQRAVNAVVHALSERYGAVHLDASDGGWIADRALWSADRLHPGERGHRRLAARFHALLTAAGHTTGRPRPWNRSSRPDPHREPAVAGHRGHRLGGPALPRSAAPAAAARPGRTAPQCPWHRRRSRHGRVGRGRRRAGRAPGAAPGGQPAGARA